VRIAYALSLVDNQIHGDKKKRRLDLHNFIHKKKTE